ncbi:MAG TPA: M56 family metallopeptidase [Planctomycetota bacterium]|nr:M56 family metallopeptidase [Planctomycetota bacterium]
MNELLHGTAAWLLTFAIHGMVVLVAAAVCCWRLPRHSGWSLLERIWRLALVAALLTSTLQVFVLRTASLDLLPVAAMAPVPTGGAAVGELAVALMPPAAAAAAPADATAVSFDAWICAVAAMAAVFGLLRLLRAERRLRATLACRLPEDDGRIAGIAARVAKAMGLLCTPHLSRCPALATPVAFGWLQPEICLPARADELDDDALAAMLAHELAHLRRRDPLWLWGTALLQALLPWQPLWWVARRQLAHSAELACDSTAARHAGNFAVAQCLLQVAEWITGRPRAPVGALAMAARPSLLRARVEAALAWQDRKAPRRLLFWPAAMSLCAVLAATVPGARWLPAAELTGHDDAAEHGGPRAVRLALAQDYEQLQQQALALRQELTAVPFDPELQVLLAQLEQRLQKVAKLRARLDAVLAQQENEFSPNGTTGETNR